MSHQSTTTIEGDLIGNNSLDWGVPRTEDGSVPGRPPDRPGTTPSPDLQVNEANTETANETADETADSGNEETEDGGTPRGKTTSGSDEEGPGQNAATIGEEEMYLMEVDMREALLEEMMMVNNKTEEADEHGEEQQGMDLTFGVLGETHGEVIGGMMQWFPEVQELGSEEPGLADDGSLPPFEQLLSQNIPRNDASESLSEEDPDADQESGEEQPQYPQRELESVASPPVQTDGVEDEEPEQPYVAEARDLTEDYQPIQTVPAQVFPPLGRHELTKDELRYRGGREPPFIFTIKMMDLKRLEGRLRKDEMINICRVVPHFRESVGQVSDIVVYSYMSSIVQHFNEQKFLKFKRNGETAAFIVTTRVSKEEVQDQFELHRDKNLVLIPLLVEVENGNHWILMTIRNRRELNYLDPACHHNYVTQPIAEQIRDRFNFLFEYNMDVTFPEHSLQQDNFSCGVFICFYARQLLADAPLTKAPDASELRLEIFQQLALFCSVGRSGSYKRSTCPMCPRVIQPECDSVRCQTCDQNFHTACVTYSYCPGVDFRCPPPRR